MHKPGKKGSREAHAILPRGKRSPSWSCEAVKRWGAGGGRSDHINYDLTELLRSTFFMMDHKYIRYWNLEVLIIHYEKYAGISIESCEGVYRPAEDTFLILDNIMPGNRVLEVGCGTGIISVYCAKIGRDVTCCDVAPAARMCAEKNAIRNRVDIEIVDSQLFRNITGTYDTIVFNPPYLPTDDRYEESEQWDGGQDGFDIIRPFLKTAADHMEDHGSIYIILSSLTDVQSLISEFEGYSFKERARQSFFFETIYLYQAFKRIAPGKEES